MLRLIVSRLAAGALTLFAASILIFATMELLPGDAAQSVLGQQAADPAAVAALRKEYGLDRPAPIRYIDWARGALEFDFGESFANKLPVTELISPRLKRTAILLGISLVL